MTLRRVPLLFLLLVLTYNPPEYFDYAYIEHMAYFLNSFFEQQDRRWILADLPSV